MLLYEKNEPNAKAFWCARLLHIISLLFLVSGEYPMSKVKSTSKSILEKFIKISSSNKVNHQQKLICIIIR